MVASWCPGMTRIARFLPTDAKPGTPPGETHSAIGWDRGCLPADHEVDRVAELGGATHMEHWSPIRSRQWMASWLDDWCSAELDDPRLHRGARPQPRRRRRSVPRCRSPHSCSPIHTRRRLDTRVLASMRRTYASGNSILLIRGQFTYAFSRVVCSRYLPIARWCGDPVRPRQWTRLDPGREPTDRVAKPEKCSPQVLIRPDLRSGLPPWCYEESVMSTAESVRPEYPTALSQVASRLGESQSARAGW